MPEKKQKQLESWDPEDVIKLLEEMKCQEPRRSFTWQCPACALGDGERTRRRTGGLGRPNDLGVSVGSELGLGPFFGSFGGLKPTKREIFTMQTR